MKYLGNFFLYSSIDCDSKIASPTPVQNPHILRGSLLKNHQSQKKVLQVSVQNPHILHGSLLKNHQLQKKVLQVLQTRGSSIQEGHGGCHGKTIL